MENTRGSEWRKWDLHVHTPASDGTGSPEEIVNKAIEQGVSVIAITDHHSVDYIDSVKQSAKDKDLSIISGIEFRSEYGSKSVHFIAYFPDYWNGVELKAEELKDLILSKLNISRTTIIAKGREQDSSLDDDQAFKKGMFLVQVDLKEASDLVHKYGGLISIHNGSKSNGLDEEVKHLGTSSKNAHSLYESLGTLKDELLNNYVDICDIRKGEESKFYLEKFNRPSILTSDAHEYGDIGSKFTWIKADPTFEGLKQIIYEPKERVKIQEENPKYDFEKSPFTEISIKDEVKLFSKDEQGNVYNDVDNISFSKTTIPLNENLVSIIGGRGTGKSRLIDYISVNLGKESKLKSEYTKSEDIIIKRATSLKENEKEFSLAESNSIPFMYISQSEIKDVVENNGKFTAKIREIIGINSDYSADENNIKEATRLLNEYSNLAFSLFADGTTSDQKKTEFEEQINRYENFITNVTSEKNKEKLTQYKESLETLNNYKKKQITAEELKTKIKNSQDELNSEINSLNSQTREIISDIQIPQIDNQEIINYIDISVIKFLKNKIGELQNNIDSTKNNFPDYKGDLASLLDNIQKYQNQVNELKTKKNRIDEEEKQMRELIFIKLKQLGEKIKNDVFQYKTDIETKWNSFISGKESYSDEQKELLKNILGTGSKGKENEKDKIELSVNIDFDESKFYNILTEDLDKRTWKKDYLKAQLGINNFNDFISFITQPFRVDLFENNVSVINNILECIYLKYTDYISHRIEILVNNKSLKKLSVGQKGTIYLRLQLAANLFSETIIYDQPEDDLDNKFINESLVNLFRSIKKYRQVIIVSHNANLVVNADSEQIIVAENNNGVLSYHSGAMENKEINGKICEILEGGQEAFEKREKKYGLR